MKKDFWWQGIKLLSNLLLSSKYCWSKQKLNAISMKNIFFPFWCWNNIIVKGYRSIPFFFSFFYWIEFYWKKKNFLNNKYQHPKYAVTVSHTHGRAQNSRFSVKNRRKLKLLLQKVIYIEIWPSFGLKRRTLVILIYPVSFIRCKACIFFSKMTTFFFSVSKHLKNPDLFPSKWPQRVDYLNDFRKKFSRGCNHPLLLVRRMIMVNYYFQNISFSAQTFMLVQHVQPSKKLNQIRQTRPVWNTQSVVLSNSESCDHVLTFHMF